MTHFVRKQKIKTRKNVLASRKKLFLRIFLIFAGFSVLFFIVKFSYVFAKNSFKNNPFFAIKSIAISELKYTQNPEFQQYLNFKIGDNIFNFDDKREEKFLLKKIKSLESVDIKKIYPSRVKIKTKERTPAFYFETKGQIFLIDKFGIIFKNISSQDLIKIDTNLLSNKKIFYETVEFSKKLKISYPDLFTKIREVRFNDKKNLAIFLKNDKIIAWGKLKNEDFETKLHFLRLIEADLSNKKQDFKEIDFSFCNKNFDYVIVR